jgi:AbrB family looped-hinge helix DNA binding protein
MAQKMEREIAILSSRGQLTLPASLRKRLKLKRGDKLNVYDVNDQFLLIEKVEETPLEAILERFQQTAKRRKLTPENLADALRDVRKGLYKEIYAKGA